MVICLRKNVTFFWEFQPFILELLSLCFYSSNVKAGVLREVLDVKGKAISGGKHHDQSENVLSCCSMVKPGKQSVTTYDEETTTGRLHTKKVQKAGGGQWAGKNAPTVRRSYQLAKYHRAFYSKFRKVSSSRTSQLISSIFGLCWIFCKCSIFQGPETVPSNTMAGITWLWCRIFLWNGWTLTTEFFSPAGTWNPWSSLNIFIRLYENIKWNFVAKSGINLGGFVQISIFLILVLHWLITSYQLPSYTSCSQKKLLMVISPEWWNVLKVSPVQFINFCKITKYAKIPLQCFLPENFTNFVQQKIYQY